MLEPGPLNLVSQATMIDYDLIDWCVTLYTLYINLNRAHSLIALVYKKEKVDSAQENTLSSFIFKIHNRICDAEG
jgi:hypothetical protein